MTEKKIWTSDSLPDGSGEEGYLKENQEWPTLRHRLGQPRILKHYHFPEVLTWMNKKGRSNDFSYFDAGCGHGNDLRVMKKLLGRGNFFGVDLSRATINRGLEFYRQRDGEDTNEAKSMFGVGNLHDLSQVKIWDDDQQDFAWPDSLKDEEFDLIYMEAVLQASGYGYKTYGEKRESAQQTLAEIYRVCKPGGKFMGRTMAFMPTVSQKERFATLRDHGSWQFIPELNELIALLKESGFKNLRTMAEMHEKAAEDPRRKDVIKLSFLGEK